MKVYISNFISRDILSYELKILMKIDMYTIHA